MPRWLAQTANVLRRIIGAPDYDAYVAHMCARHPGEEQLSRDAFAADALTRRYSTPGNRCC